MSAAETGKSQFAELEAGLAGRMRRALEGDTQAYGELLRKIRDLLSGYFARHLARYGVSDRSFADDLLQETLLGIHEKRATYDPSQPFTPWMYAIARYKIIDLLRKRKHLHLEDDIEVVDLISEAVPHEEWHAKTELKTILEGLPDRQREVLELTKVQELPVAEVARRLGMSVSSVKVTVHRTVKALREKMQEELS